MVRVSKRSTSVFSLLLMSSIKFLFIIQTSTISLNETTQTDIRFCLHQHVHKLSLSISLSLSHTNTHTHTHTHTHTQTNTHTQARARAHTHTHTHTHKLMKISFDHEIIAMKLLIFFLQFMRMHTSSPCCPPSILKDCLAR